MKVSNYLMSTVIRLVKDNPPDSPNKAYIGDLSNALRDRYSFLQWPVKIEEFDLQKGINFLHGRFKEDQIIDKIQVYSNGVYCEAKLPNEVIEEFVDDVFEWVHKDFGLILDDAIAPSRFYTSQLEVKSDYSPAQALSKFSPIGDKITQFLNSYGQVIPAFETTHLAFLCDTTNVENLAPTKFTFERREQQPFDAGLYFSAAPLKTKDHLKVLNELEKILAN